MTSVSFPFFVGTPDADKKIPLLDAEFRFTTKHARALEKAAGESLGMLLARGQSVEALVLLVCYGLKWDSKLKMTEDKAVDLIDEFVDAKGNTVALFSALYAALYESGVYGLPKDDAVEKTADGASPLA